MYDSNGAWHMGGMWFWWIACIVIVVAIIWAVLRTYSRKDSNGGASAEELLKRQYAKGEINKDDYEQRLHDLRR